jgi:hypothetical protein
MQAIRSSETSVIKRATRRTIQEDGKPNRNEIMPCVSVRNAVDIGKNKIGSEECCFLIYVMTCNLLKFNHASDRSASIFMVEE